VERARAPNRNPVKVSKEQNERVAVAMAIQPP